MMRCPCHGCELRGPGCHNPARCGRWAEYLAATETARAKAAQSKRSTVIMQDYVKDKTKNLRKRKR